MGFFNFLSSPGPTTTQTTSSDSFANPYWQQYLSGLNNTLGQNPIQPYGGPTVAPQNFMQNTANDMQYNLATGGSPAGNMANSAIVAQASGANLANPYATTLNPYMGAQNSYQGATNPYEGQNPYLQSMIDSSNNDITHAYQTGTAAQTDSAFNRAGAFGGSAYQDQVANNQDMLGKTLSANTSNLQYQNYLNSGQLAQNDLARNSALEQTGINNNQQLGENALNRATGAYQNGLQQQLSAANLGLQSQGVDQNAIMGLNALGGQQQNYQQNLLNGMQNYFTQSQQAPYMGYDIMGQALNNYSNANRTSTTQGPATSGVTNAIGGAGALYTFGQQQGWW